ncbi:ABC transporter substrate-binding protein [Bacillus sp. FSL K6-3431]|uniref:ABC transporter substrate-binding protein n=1 Tax=Bacillus sp. FSL K6-3431 TaxID=2921500 RepID=UPI0030F8DC39
MKHKPIIFIAMLLILTLFLVACNKDGKTSTTPKDKSKQDEEIKLSEPGTFPITEEKVTLRVLVPASPSVEDFKTNKFTKWYEEKTNVHIEWEVMPDDNALNLVLASGDLPDVIMNTSITPSQLMIYGGQGMFLKLNELIEGHGKDTKELLEERPDIKDALTTPDGSIYSLPVINECYHCTMSQKLWVYEPWLDALDLKMPETTEEFYQVLKAFKEKDPNGNGKQDEIAISGSKDVYPYPSFLMNPFIYSEMYLDDGEIKVPYISQEWKEGLTFIHKLYKEGLMAKESLTQDGDQLKRMGNSKETILGMSMGNWPGSFIDAGQPDGKWLDYKAVPPLLGPDGNRVSWYSPAVPARAGYIITNQAKHPEVALRWAEGFYDPEVTLRAEAGEPDKDWRWAEDGETGIDGEAAMWARLSSFGQMQNSHWSQRGPLIRTNEFRLGEVESKEVPLEPFLYNETKDKYEPYKDESKALPPLYFSEEQSAELSELETTITSFVEESNARFISGDEDIEKGWKTYLKTLEGMNVERFIEIYQEAYDAKYK